MVVPRYCAEQSIVQYHLKNGEIPHTDCYCTFRARYPGQCSRGILDKGTPMARARPVNRAWCSERDDANGRQVVQDLDLWIWGRGGSGHRLTD